MVTCCVRQCLKRANLDAEGYCPDHTRDNTEAEEVVTNCGACNSVVQNDESSQALQCEAEQCKVWYHLTYTSISAELYELMNASSADTDSGIRWYVQIAVPRAFC